MIHALLLSLLPATALVDAPGGSRIAEAHPIRDQADRKAQRVAARGKGGLTIDESELEELLLLRYALSEDGRELLELLLKTKLLDHLARQAGLDVGESEVHARWQELDRRARGAGEQGIGAEIRRRGLTPEEFREFLRLAIVQEELTRRALGLGRNEPVTGAQQEIWLGQEQRERGLERLPPPWKPKTGVVVRCGEIGITTGELAGFLRANLPPDKLREGAWHLLLQKAIERRLPDLAPSARDEAIETELARRRREHAREYPGIPFEQRLGATGQTLATLRADPSVAIAALSRLWVDRKHGPEGLRKAFSEERRLFEGRFGRAARSSMLYLVAGRFVNEMVPRTFEEAEDELRRIKDRIGDRNDFMALVSELSEQPGPREQRGELGWVTRGDPRAPVQLREAMFDFLDTGNEVPAGGVAIGPVRIESGCVLLWVDEVRPSPSWEVMAEHVHAELRRRLVEECMPPDAVVLGSDGSATARSR